MANGVRYMDPQLLVPFVACCRVFVGLQTLIQIPEPVSLSLSNSFVGGELFRQQLDLITFVHWFLDVDVVLDGTIVP